MKIPAAKAAVDKEWENLEKIPAWDLTKVRSKKEVIDEARTKSVKVHFASLMDICHLKNAELEAKQLKYKRSSCTPRRHCKRWFWTLCSIYRTRIISITNDSSKSHGYHLQIAWVAMDKQLTQYPLVPRSKWKMHQHYWRFQSQNVQIFGYYYRSTNVPNHGPVWKIQSFERKESVRLSFGRTIMGKAIRESSISWEKVSNWECLFVHREKGLFLSVYVDDIKLAGKKQKYY